MAINKVEICGVDTSTLPVLKNERMRELFPRIHAGDKEARREFIQGNLRLVLSVIQRFHNRGESVDDLFQVGCIGLMKAIDNFDTGQNVRFSTYAVPMIIGEIRRYLRDNNQIRVSRSLRDTAYKALKARERLTYRLGREPNIQEIAAEMEVREEDVVLALEAIQDPVSLFDPVYQDGGDAIYVMDQVRDERVSEDEWVRDLSIRQALEKLKRNAVMSHRDLDSKNVLWNRGEPFIIDWEAAGPVPPALELWEALLNWGRDGGGKLRPDRIAALLDAYRQWNSLPPPDWESVGHAGYAGMLGWLNYNIARSSNPALSPEERQLGAEQTAITLKEIIEYEEQAPQLRRLIDG